MSAAERLDAALDRPSSKDWLLVRAELAILAARVDDLKAEVAQLKRDRRADNDHFARCLEDR